MYFRLCWLVARSYNLNNAHSFVAVLVNQSDRRYTVVKELWLHKQTSPSGCALGIGLFTAIIPLPVDNYNAYLGYGLLVSMIGKRDSIFCLTMCSLQEISKSTMLAICPLSCIALFRHPLGIAAPSFFSIRTTSRVNTLLVVRMGGSGCLCRLYPLLGL